ncbi:arylesterase [Aureimonas flava]|uniref:Arylesterase n=1 Tax=Aureimonas flava TaxID=2320271 RepID=A0A3A1WMP0_9HYPH|nr:arylesterase [Aureimonas flava]RIY00997.1 arylesterase [Aureimonas flava]
MQRFQSLLAFVTIGLGLALAAPAGAQQAAPEVVAFGDSLSAGYGVGPGESFPEQLGAALAASGHPARVVNAGVSGDTTAGGLARLDWSVPASADVVIVELGANDALRGVSPDVTRANLDAILGKLKARPHTQVLLAGMIAPPNMGADFATAFNPIYTDLARKHDVPLYPFFLDGVAGQAGLNQQDYMHPNAKGVAVIVRGILPQVVQALEAAAGAKG